MLDFCSASVWMREICCAESETGRDGASAYSRDDASTLPWGERTGVDTAGGARLDLGRCSDRPWGGRLLGLLGRDPARMFRAFSGQPFRKRLHPSGVGRLRRGRGEIDDATVFISAGSALDRRGSFRRTGGRLLGSLGRDPARMFRAFSGWRGRRRGAIDHATAFASSAWWRRLRKDLARRSNGARLADTTRISAGSALDWRWSFRPPVQGSPRHGTDHDESRHAAESESAANGVAPSQTVAKRPARERGQSSPRLAKTRLCPLHAGPPPFPQRLQSAFHGTTGAWPCRPAIAFASVLGVSAAARETPAAAPRAASDRPAIAPAAAPGTPETALGRPAIAPATVADVPAAARGPLATVLRAGHGRQAGRPDAARDRLAAAPRAALDRLGVQPAAARDTPETALGRPAIAPATAPAAPASARDTPAAAPDTPETALGRPAIAPATVPAAPASARDTPAAAPGTTGIALVGPPLRLPP